MFLSNEILKKYNACELGLEWFDRHYPNGVELMDFLDSAQAFVGPDSKILELLYWGYLLLPYDEREKEKYVVRICQSHTCFSGSYSRRVSPPTP